MPKTLRRIAAAAWLLCTLIATAPSGFGAEPNLDPVLLRDTDEMRTYIADFPFEQHMRVKYPNMGCSLSVYPSSFMPCLFDWWMEPIVGTFWIEQRRPRDSIKEIMMHGGVWEPLVVRAIQTYTAPGSTVVDIGAYIGTHSMLMGRMVGDTGRVYAFEPQRKVYRELVQNVALNGMEGVVVPLRFALGDKTDFIEMNRPIEIDVAGPDATTTVLLEGSVSVGAGGDRAEMRPLDDFSFSNVSLIKIDVEGHENAVLEGASGTIAENRPVVVLEIIGGGTVYPGAPSAYYLPQASPEQLEIIHATWRLLERHGYEVRPIADHDYIAFPLERSDAPWPVPVPRAASSAAELGEMTGR